MLGLVLFKPIREVKLSEKVSALAVISSALFMSTSLRAVDFIRGDSNSDGKVSVADAKYIANYVFRGGERPECLESADVNVDGSINLSDVLRLLLFLVLDGEPPAAPYPNPGPGTGAAGLDCASYGGGARGQDPIARINVRDAVIAGGEEQRGTITFEVSNSVPIGGYSGKIEVQDSVLGWVSTGSVTSDLTGTLGGGFLAACMEGNVIELGFLGSFTDDRSIPPGEDHPVLELGVCLAKGARAGQYSLAVIDGELVDDASGRSIPAAPGEGTLTVLEDLAPGKGCEPSVGCNRDAPPQNITSSYTLVATTGLAGSEVVVPFLMGANYQIQGYMFSVDFDEEILEATEVERVFEKPDGTDYAFASFYFNNEDKTPGNGGVDEGFVVGAAVFSFLDSDNNIPPGEHEALAFHFNIAPETSAKSTEVRFQDGARCPVRDQQRCHIGGEAVNILVVDGVSRDPIEVSAIIFTSAVINILPDGTFFVRGDSNGDGKVNISDPEMTLSYLFLGGGRPRCFDAADANDDGKLDISDPISTLYFLFAGGPKPRPPFPEPGEDPTEDRIGCSFITQ